MASQSLPVVDCHPARQLVPPAGFSPLADGGRSPARSGTECTPHEGWAAINQRAGEQGAILKPRRRFGKRSGDTH